MGRTALYRDPVPWRPARAEVHLEPDALILRLPDGRHRHFALDGCTPATLDGFFAARVDIGYERRFVRMLVLERQDERQVVITPPDQGAVAPNVVRVPEAPAESSIVDVAAWDALADWIMGGGRFSGCSIPELARLAAIASPQFAVLIGEIAAERALDQLWATSGPLRGESDLEIALQPLVVAARHSARVAEALLSALAYVSGSLRRRRRTW